MVKYEGRNIRLQVERIAVSSQIEKFEITAANKSLTIKSNRPLLRSKGIKSRKPDYKLIAGIMHNHSLLDKIVASYMNGLNGRKRSNLVAKPLLCLN